VQIQPDGAEQPGERVQAKKGEGSDEQSRHPQEDRVEQGIIFLIKRVGVRPVFGKFLGRARMAFLAGHQNIGGREMRGRVRRRQDIVEAVAIIAGGDFRRRIGPAESHGLAMVGFAIMVEAVLMALAATLVADRLEIIASGVDDFVRAMAIDTDGSALIALRQELAVDAFVIGFLNAHMAFAAGFCDIRVVDGRIAIHAAFDFVGAVTIIAGRRDDQAHFQQGAAMDAIHVLRGGLGKFDLIFLGEFLVAMTLGAGLGQV